MIGRMLSRLHRQAGPGPSRYVVSIRMTGLGDRLICLGAAWLFARNTGRTLIADWRYGAYSMPTGRNIFALCFEPLPDLAGVPFIGDDRVAGLHLPRPRHPAPWNHDAFLKAPYLRPSNNSDAERDAAVALIHADRDVPARTVVFDACVNDGLVSTADSRAFLSALRPALSVSRSVAVFRNEFLHGYPMIGLHVRHGNGAEAGNHAHYWHSFHASIDRCARAVQVARAHLGRDMPVLLCTDSSEVERAIHATISGVISRRKTFRPPGAGELHLWRESSRTLHDALVEMLLLAESSALIRYPPGSFFSFYAAVMGRRQTPSPLTVYDLQRPYDREDPLSPALLL